MTLKKKYNVKYIQKPGNKQPTPLYEISPGTWVTRGNTPEAKAYRKKYHEDPVNAVRSKLRWKKYHSENRDLLVKKQRLSRKKNKKHKTKVQDAWNSSEYGFMMNLYGNAKKDARKGRHGGNPFVFEFDRKTWWEHWLKQKLEYGMNCPYSVLMGKPVTMTHIRGKRDNKKVPTNISRDQIWPGEGYTQKNLVFCSNKFNCGKKSIDPIGCWAVLKLYNQRITESNVNIKTGPEIYGSEYHLKAIKEHYLNALPKKYNIKIMNMAYLQSKLEKAKDNNDLIATKKVELEIKKFYEKK